MKNIWHNFSKKNILNKIKVLFENGIIDSNFYNLLLNNEILSNEIAEQITENTIGTFSLPLSIVPEIIVNDIKYTVPMVTEEPSVVAACSYSSKLISKCGGFKSEIKNKFVIGEICIYNIENIDHAISEILKNKNLFIEIANDSYPSIVSRGGGAIDLDVKAFSNDEISFLVVYLTVDTKEAMGANIVNTMLESLKNSLKCITNGEILMAILSNYSTKSIVISKCEIDIKYLSNDIEEAKKIAKKIELATHFSNFDIYRATTNNKGIFNGIDAVAIATGNDFRAIESGGHAYAAKSGSYKSLTNWFFNENENKLIGTIELPLSLGTVGGTIGLNPSVKLAHHILKNPDAKTLTNIIASIGLAQNFAALKALVTTGIQNGHMKMQARALALSSGAKNDEIEYIVSELINSKKFNRENVTNIINNLRKNKLD